MNVLVDLKTNKNPINQCYFIKCGVNWSLRCWNSLFYGTQNTFNDAISRPITYALIAPIIRYVSVIRSPNNTLIACIPNFSAIICDCIKTKFQCAFDWYHCVYNFCFFISVINYRSESCDNSQQYWSMLYFEKSFTANQIRSHFME